MKGGLSGCCGIMLYETAKEGENSVYGYYENERIVLRTGPFKELKKFKTEQEKEYSSQNKKDDKAVILLMLMMMAIVGIVFFTCPLRWFFGSLVLAAAAYMPILVLCFANMNTYNSEELRQQFRRFHGCEHALLSCFVHGKNGKKTVFELEDLKKASYYDPECGTVYCGYALFLLAVITIMLLNFSSLGFMKFIGILAGTVVLLFLNLFNPLNPFKILQKPAVAQPTDHEYLLGLEVMKTFKTLTGELPGTPDGEEK